MRTAKKQLARQQERANKQTVETLTEWLKAQFTAERMIRWLDGANPNPWSRSWIGLWHHKSPPQLGSHTNVTTPQGKRDWYRLVVQFHNQNQDTVVATLEMSHGWRHYSKRSSTLLIRRTENAPKKLNKAIRALRQELGL